MMSIGGIELATQLLPMINIKYAFEPSLGDFVLKAYVCWSTAGPRIDRFGAYYQQTNPLPSAEKRSLFTTMMDFYKPLHRARRFRSSHMAAFHFLHPLLIPETLTQASHPNGQPRHMTAGVDVHICTEDLQRIYQQSQYPVLDVRLPY